MFTVGFEKVADTATNNQGLELQHADTNNATANVGPGGMSPQGIPSYSPNPPSPTDTGKKKKGMNPVEIGQFFMQKGASEDSLVGRDRSSENSNIAEGVVDGLKYDSSTPEDTKETCPRVKLGKKKHRTYIRAGLK